MREKRERERERERVCSVKQYLCEEIRLLLNKKMNVLITYKAWKLFDLINKQAN